MDAITIKEFYQNTQHPSNELIVSHIMRSAAVLMFCSLQLSNKGKVLAEDEPYVIRDSQARILVIHAAEHVREFFRNDEKGKSGMSKCWLP